MQKLLVSMCLLGAKVRYDGNHNSLDQNTFETIFKRYKVYPMCPELMGGLSVPRTPSELSKDGLVYDQNGLDVTNEFLIGAYKALDICLKNDIKIALLKENSPSCGVNKTYNGEFNNTLIDNSGLTTRILKKNNITVFSEKEIDKLFN